MAVAMACAIGATADAQQDEEKPPRDFRPAPPAAPPRPQEFRFSFTYNLSYPRHIDRDNIASLTMASTDAVHLALQDAADDPWYFRVPKWGVAFGIDSAIRYVAHEYGHLSSFSKAGYRKALFGDKDKILTSAPKASIGKMFINGFNPFDDSAVSISQSDWNRIIADMDEDPVKIGRFRVLVKAGGLNQEAVDLEHYSERLLDGRLSHLDTMPFIISGAAVLRYPVDIEMSDVGDYITELRDLGNRTTAGQIHRLSAVTLLSGSTLAALRGFFLGLTTGQGGMVEPFALRVSNEAKVFAPELENFLSQYGPTLKPSIPIKLWDWWVRPSYEVLFVGGASMTELGLAVRGPIFPFLAIHGAGYQNSDGGTWLESGFEILPWSWLSLNVGYAWAREYSFHRDVYGASNDILKRAEAGINLGVSAWYLF
jgi:hypothetical protein